MRASRELTKLPTSNQDL